MEFSSILKSEMNDFLALRKKSCSKSCYDHDVFYIRSFDRYLFEHDVESKSLTESVITNWIRSLTGKSSTIAGKVIVIRIFLSFLKGYGISPYIPEIPKVHDDYVPYIFSDKEMKDIFSVSHSLTKGRIKTNSFIHLEMPMILRIMYGCGTRLGETLSIQMKDVDLDRGCLLLRKTKYNKERVVPMHESLTAILKNYCYAMGCIANGNAFLFPANEEGSPLTAKSAKHKFDSILAEAGITRDGYGFHERGPCLHCLRHVFAFTSFSQIEHEGISENDAIPYLSIYLGHDSLNETEKYLKFSSESFPEDMELFEKASASLWPEVDYEF